MRKLRGNTLWAVVGSLLFLGLPLLRPFDKGDFFTTWVIKDLISNVIILLFFFLNYYLFIPHLFFKRQFWAYGICIGFGLLCIGLIPTLAVGHNLRGFSFGSLPGFGPGPGPVPGTGPAPDSMGNPPGGFLQGPPPPFRGLTRPQFTPYAGTNNVIFEITHSFYLYMTVILFSLLLRVRSRLYMVQREKMIAELNSLKNQINPHFLFNTLNSIYALAVRKDEQTADSIINLAGMMRYMIKDASGEKIALQKELDFLSHYIELQKNRLRSTAQVAFSISGNPSGLDIAPLILISFIENAFKYGVNPDMDSPVSIHIDIEKEALNMAVSNYKVLVTHPEHSTRIGLANTRKRLDLLYQRKHHLDIKEDKEKYAVNLSIQLI
jgi:hypothetical protein